MLINKQLTMAIPKGSLVKDERSGLRLLLDKAYIWVENLSGDRAPKVVNYDGLVVKTGRPQNLPGLAHNMNYCDIFVCGDDWAKEWELLGAPSVKMVGLNTGQVKLAYAEREDVTAKPLVVVASEYPQIALDYMKRKLGAVGRTDLETAVIKSGMQIPLEEGLIVMESPGATESLVVYGVADAAVEATQSGRSLKSWGLTVTDIVMDSECSLYRTVAMANDPYKMEQAENITLALKAARDAMKSTMMTMNVGATNLGEVTSYLDAHDLYRDAPTISDNADGSKEIVVQIPTNNGAMPVAKVRGDLTRLGAKDIVCSSIDSAL